MRTRSFLLFASLLAGCGGASSNEETAPALAGADPPLLFAARDPSTDTLVVAAIDPATGKVSTMGTSLPGVAASTHTIGDFQESQDGKRVGVTARPLDPKGASITFVSDAAGAFREVARSAGEVSVGFNHDLSLIWRQPACDGGKDASLRAQLFDARGKVVFEAPACPGSEAGDAAGFFGFLRDGTGALFLEHQTDLVVHNADGTSRVLKKYPATSTTPNVGLRRLFATSVIVAHEGKLDWLDLEGRSLDVAGFSREASALSFDGFVIAETQLSKLADREVAPLQQVPAGTRAFDVQAAAPGRFAVLAKDGKLRTVAPTGVVRGEYEVPLGHHATINGTFGSLAGATPWLVATFSQSGEDQGDYTPSYGRGEILVRFDAEGNVKETTTLRHIEDAKVSGTAGARVYRGSKSGSHLVMADDAFHVVSTASGEDRVLDTPLRPVVPGGNVTLTWTPGKRDE